MKNIKIYETPEFVGKKIKLNGWIRNKRSSKKIIFLQFRDGTGFIQVIVEKDKVGDEKFEEIKKMNQESSIEIIGTVSKDDRSSFGYEIKADEINLISESIDYPITPKDHGTDFLMDNRHLYLRHLKEYAILRIRDTIKVSSYNFFNNKNFVNIDAPILTSSSPEGTTELFETDYFGQNAFLSQTGQLYGETAAMAFGNIYTFGPTFRAEKSKTRRHLTEFWMLEPEMTFTDLNQSMDLQEEYIKFLIESVINKNSSELEMLGRDISVLKNYLKVDFPKITYTKAIELLKENDFDVEWGDDFGSPEETFLANHFNSPIFVTNYPKEATAFYMKQNPLDEKTVLNSDLLAPEGYGEIIGGSERETDINYLLDQIEKQKLSKKDYDWFLDTRRFGSVQHSGFGMGLERVVTWISGTEHIRDAIPFPRTITRIKP